MGQPFLLTPTYDSRQNPLFTSQSYNTPPASSLAAAGLSPSIGGMSLEQLKLQYERTQQMIQQQLLFSQMQNMLQQQQGPDRVGGVADGSGGTVRGVEADGGSVRGAGKGDTDGEGSQYLNGSDVMMGSQSPASSASRPIPTSSTDDSISPPPPNKKARVDTSSSTGQ